jgi:hypothetical protein
MPAAGSAPAVIGLSGPLRSSARRGRKSAPNPTPESGGNPATTGLPAIVGVAVHVPETNDREEGPMSTQETGHITGTKDKDYNLIWFTEACLNNALRLETYIQDAERAGDNELAEFFRRAQGESRKGADQAKTLLVKRLAG